MIEEKLQKHWDGYNDAFDYILNSAKENNYDISLQDLKVCFAYLLQCVFLLFLFYQKTSSLSMPSLPLFLSPGDCSGANFCGTCHHGKCFHVTHSTLTSAPRCYSEIQGGNSVVRTWAHHKQNTCPPPVLRKVGRSDQE